MQEKPRKATCACGEASVTVSGSPIVVNACSCTDCQRRSGSAFTYTAFYANADVVASGALKTFRNLSESGRWRDSDFCPACGITMLSRLEVFPQATGIPAGLFADTDFQAPSTFFWTKHRHGWYAIDTLVSEKTEQ